MGELFPVNLTSLFVDALEEDQRKHIPSGKLRTSSELNGSLRHAQLRVIGVPAKPPTIAAQIRLATGTLWHKWFQLLLVEKGVKVWTEVKLDDYLPEGWGGIADYVFYNPRYEAFVLGDLKTTKGESMFFINRDGAKEDHIWQLSAYFYALVDMGLPMLDTVGILYVPMNDLTSGGVTPEPSLQEVSPIPREVIHGRMKERWESVVELREYMALEGYQFNPNGTLAEFDVPGWETNTKLSGWLTGALAPEQERIHKLVWDAKKSVLNVVLVPHWSAAYCEWSPPYCSCSEQGQTKIGHYDLDGEYHPRKGYELVYPLVEPTRKELNLYEQRASR